MVLWGHYSGALAKITAHDHNENVVNAPAATASSTKKSAPGKTEMTTLGQTEGAPIKPTYEAPVAAPLKEVVPQ